MQAFPNLKKKSKPLENLEMHQKVLYCLNIWENAISWGALVSLLHSGSHLNNIIQPNQTIPLQKNEYCSLISWI